MSLEQAGRCSFSNMFSSYFDCEVRSQGAGDPQDLLIRELLEVQSGVLQLVLTWPVQQQLTSDPLESFTLHVCIAGKIISQIRSLFSWVELEYFFLTE